MSCSNSACSPFNMVRARKVWRLELGNQSSLRANCCGHIDRPIGKFGVVRCGRQSAMLTGSLHTVFGWHLHIGEKSNPRSLRNFPAQGNGSEMLRIACCLATERGIEVCALIHDAVLICAPLDRLEADVNAMQAAMVEASRAVLSGFELRTDVDVVRWPSRYSTARGAVMWDRVVTLLGRPELKQLSA